MKSKFCLFIFFSAVFVNQLYAMQNQTKNVDTDNKIIEFEGEKQSLMEWLIAILADHKHPFSVTDVYRVSNEILIYQGDTLKINPKDLTDIYKNNFIYCPNYTSKTTRLNPQPVVISAIILGTKDKTMGNQLLFEYQQKSATAKSCQEEQNEKN